MAELIPLEIFMDRAARQPFEYGVHDCCLFLADWVRNVRGVDPAAHLRGRYHSQWGYRRVCILNGGLPLLVAGCAQKAGLVPTAEPKRGDIGLLWAWVEPELAPGGLARPKRSIVGAICAGRRWLSLGPGGMIAAPAQKPAMAWRV